MKAVRDLLRQALDPGVIRLCTDDLIRRRMADQKNLAAPEFIDSVRELEALRKLIEGGIVKISFGELGAGHLPPLDESPLCDPDNVLEDGSIPW